jgi:hypothetical protein
LENGAYWYMLSGKSFGFAGNQSINLNTADTNSDNPTERLSWHLTSSGGYRIGNIFYPNNSYYKIIIQYEDRYCATFNSSNQSQCLECK